MILYRRDFILFFFVIHYRYVNFLFPYFEINTWVLLYWVKILHLQIKWNRIQVKQKKNRTENEKRWTHPKTLLFVYIRYRKLTEIWSPSNVCIYMYKVIYQSRFDTLFSSVVMFNGPDGHRHRRDVDLEKVTYLRKYPYIFYCFILFKLSIMI